MIVTLIDNVHNLPIPMLGEYIKIIKIFYLNILFNFSKKGSDSAIKKGLFSKINLNILWEAVQDDSKLSNKNKITTLEVLIELMIAFDLQNTSEFLVKAIENLKLGQSSIKCMTMIEKILESTVRKGYPSVFKKEDLVQLAITSAEIYLSSARQNSPMDGRSIEDMVFSGSLPHKQTIEKYFNFISYLLTKFDGHNKLDNGHIEAMFKVFVKDSISSIERSSFYKFFTYDEFDMSNQDNKKVASSKNREFLFQNILCTELNSENTSPCEFKCFETNFFYINTLRKNLRRESNEQVFRTISMKLDGLELVWDFSIFSPNEEIRTECNNFLAELYLFNEKENHRKRGQNNATFFEAWLEKILTIDQSNKEAISNILRLLFNFVKRYDGHHMDSVPFEKYETDLEIEMADCPKDKAKKYVMKVNREMTIGAIRKRVGDYYGIIPSEILIISARSYLSETCMNDNLSQYKDCKNIKVRRRTLEERELELPRYLAAENLKLTSQVIEKGLESENHALRCESLQFFEYIPANTERKKKMVEWLKLSSSNDVSSWCNFLYCSKLETQGIYFGLKIMKSIIQPDVRLLSSKEAEDFLKQKNVFYHKFWKNNGFPLLCETLIQLNVKNILRDVVWLSIFQMLSQILKTILDDELFTSLMTSEKEDTFHVSSRKLVSQCWEILSITSENVSLDRDLSDTLFTAEESKMLSEDKVKNIKYEYEELETDFNFYMINLLKSCLQLNPEQFEVFYSSDFIKKAKVVNLLVLHPNKYTMKRVSTSLLDLCKTFRAIPDSKQNPVLFFAKLLTDQLGNILTHETLKQSEYFNLFDAILRLINHADLDKISFNSASVAEMLFNTITSRHIIEQDDVQDPILSGCILMLSTLDELFHDSIKDGCPGIYSKDFLNFVLSKGLFSRVRPSEDDDTISYPLCKHFQTRGYAFRLLQQLFGYDNMTDIAKFLEPYIKTGSWRSNKREKWNIVSSQLSHRTSYVGLVNLGCTCYMNSLMQQLYMCPQFRNFICTAQDLKKSVMKLEDNVLYHSKYLFANLMKNKSLDFNPVVFFNSIKDYSGEPMPTNEQRDVDEFLNIYMDKIEQNIKGGEDEKHLSTIFGGAFAQELICKDCPHRSSREEQYLSVSLEIKNKANIHEALDLFIQGEMLEGDNAYMCERCDKKIDTLKRCCIKKLPNTLILSLKRFEFDLETLSRYKLNTYCEFYDDLDMRDYCQETLAKKELLKTMTEQNLTYEMLSEDQKAIHNINLPDNYYKYKLKGTVVHYGTADGGHYYSYIKDRDSDKWFEFNDTSVREFDPAELPEETFGGKLKYEHKFMQGGKQYTQTEKLNNAYILIYEREEFINTEKVLELRETEKSQLEKMSDSYKFESRPCKIEPEILKDLMLSFDKHWIANKMFDDWFIETVISMWLNSCTFLQLNSERALKQVMDVDESDEELYKLKFSTLFVLCLALRSESKLRFASKILPQIRENVKRSMNFAKWLVKCFCNKHTINELVASCWNTESGRMITSLLKLALRKVMEEEKPEVKKISKLIMENWDGSPETYVQFLIGMMNDEKVEVPLTFRCMYQFMIVTMAKVNSVEFLIVAHYLFLSMLDEFANLDTEFRRMMINFRIHLMWISLAFSSNSSLDTLVPGIVFGKDEIELDSHIIEIDSLENLSLADFDENDLGNFTVHRLNKLEQIMLQNMAKHLEPFLYEFRVMSKLVRSWEIISENRPNYTLSQHRMSNPEPVGQISLAEFHSLVEPSENVQNVLFGSRWVNKSLRNELGKMFSHLLFDDLTSITFWKTLISNMNHAEYLEIDQYERILYTLLTMKDSFSDKRIEQSLTLSSKLIDNNLTNYSFIDMFCATLIKFSKKSSLFRDSFYQNKIVDKINKWLSSNPTPPINSIRGPNGVFMSSKSNNKFSYEIIGEEVDVIKDFNNSCRADLKVMSKKQHEWEDPDPESEDDLLDVENDAGSKIDFIPQGSYHWASGVVVYNVGDMIRIEKSSDDMEVDGASIEGTRQWMCKDDTEIAPAGTKTRSKKANVLSIYNKAFNC